MWSDSLSVPVRSCHITLNCLIRLCRSNVQVGPPNNPEGPAGNLIAQLFLLTTISHKVNWQRLCQKCPQQSFDTETCICTVIVGVPKALRESQPAHCNVCGAVALGLGLRSHHQRHSIFLAIGLGFGFRVYGLHYLKQRNSAEIGPSTGTSSRHTVESFPTEQNNM